MVKTSVKDIYTAVHLIRVVRRFQLRNLFAEKLSFSEIFGFLYFYLSIIVFRYKTKCPQKYDKNRH